MDGHRPDLPDLGAAVANGALALALAYATMLAAPGAEEHWSIWRVVRIAVGVPLVMWICGMALGLRR